MTKKLLTLVLGLSFSAAFAQNELYNNGSVIFIQKDALIHVQGSFINKDNGLLNDGITTNNGILELRGDFENVAGAEFKQTDATSTDRSVKFVGSGTQTIKGDINTPGTATFYNLVVDKVSATDQVEMQANVAVEGSLIFGNTTSTTYNPSSTFTHPNNKGIVTTYSGGTDYLLDIRNTNTDAITGHEPLVMNNLSNTGYVLVSGSKTNTGGVQRAVTATSYVYPIATTTNGYNPARINFSVVHLGGRVKGKFNDVSGPFAIIDYEYPQFPLYPDDRYPADNYGFNYWFADNPCVTGTQEQWLVLEDGIQDLGYWSFEGTGTNNSYVHTIETFPTNFTTIGSPTDIARVIKYSGISYDADASIADWSTQILSSIPTPDDLLTYSSQTGAGCYSGGGMIGGRYTGFSHFGVAKSKSGGGLPVELLYIKATAINNEFIQVSWATALEINNDGFWVERSVDANNWTALTWVDGHDNSTIQHNYAYDDYAVAKGVVYYYRLKQVDNDGAFTYTYIVNAKLNGELTFNVMDFVPNPTSDFTNLLISSDKDQTISVKFYNTIGQQVLSEQININQGASNITFDLSILAAGTYMGVVNAANETFSKKIVITR